MKIVFHAPVAIAETVPETAQTKRPARGHTFAPLWAPAIYENRIDLARKASVTARKYPYKRFDESVN